MSTSECTFSIAQLRSFSHAQEELQLNICWTIYSIIPLHILSSASPPQWRVEEAPQLSGSCSAVTTGHWICSLCFPVFDHTVSLRLAWWGGTIFGLVFIWHDSCLLQVPKWADGLYVTVIQNSSREEAAPKPPQHCSALGVGARTLDGSSTKFEW